MKIFIKNMVCNRCIMVVRQLLHELHLQPGAITLGEAELKLSEPLAGHQITDLQQRLAANGFELLDDRRKKMVERVKNVITELIHGSDEIDLDINFSTYIQQRAGMDYKYLSSLFSATESVTIEQYIILQRIERAKELLAYNELSLGEISWKLGYKSVQHLSTQFKKTTGMTPSHFKTLKGDLRKPLDQI